MSNNKNQKKHIINYYLVQSISKLVFFLFTLLIYVNSTFAAQQKSVSFRSPERKIVTIFEGGLKGNIDEELSDIYLPGISSSLGDRTICGENSRIDTQFAQTRAQLELATLIEKLKSAEKPRILTMSETETLASIPFCAPFTFDLRIISKLLSNYDYISTKQARK